MAGVAVCANAFPIANAQDKNTKVVHWRAFPAKNGPRAALLLDLRFLK
jgi:hypothetical protein